jgi:hypothetical protein
VTEPASKPLRTWRPMAAWTAAILLALGLAWFVGAVAVPVWQVRSALPTPYQLDWRGPVEQAENGPLAEEGNQLMRVWGFEKRAIDRLGGCERAVRRLSFYLRAPRWLAPDKLHAFRFLVWCEQPARPAILEAMEDPDPSIRLAAIAGIMANGCARRAQDIGTAVFFFFPDGDDDTRARASARLEWLLSDGDPKVRAAAAEALKKIRGEEAKQ